MFNTMTAFSAHRVKIIWLDTFIMSYRENRYERIQKGSELTPKLNLCKRSFRHYLGYR
jgi:hypothetical protein